MLNHVADGEALDGLVLGNTAGAVGAAEEVDMSTAMLGATIVSSLLSLL